MTKLEWNVFYHSINSDEIKTANIFEHGGLRKDLREISQTAEGLCDFAQRLDSSLRYYFWCKCEWEVLISPWCGGNAKPVKVDVYRQIKNAWDAFVQYCWLYREELSQ